MPDGRSADDVQDADDLVTPLADESQTGEPGSWWTRLPEGIVLVCAALLPVILGINVVARYTGWYSVRWAQDVTEILFVWLVFLGGALAVKYGAHVRMAALSDAVTSRYARVGRAWSHVVMLSPIFLGVALLALGVPLVELSMSRELPNLRLPTGYYMTAVPISGALIIGYGARIYWRQVVRGSVRR